MVNKLNHLDTMLVYDSTRPRIAQLKTAWRIRALTWNGEAHGAEVCDNLKAPIRAGKSAILLCSRLVPTVKVERHDRGDQKERHQPQ
jgi:hypothetical protein